MTVHVHGYEMTGAGEPLRPATRTVEEPGDADALVEVAGCGLCHTDLGFLDRKSVV